MSHASSALLRTCPFGELYLLPSRNGLMRPKSVRGHGVAMVNMGELFAYDRIGDVPMESVPLSQGEAERFLLMDGDLLFARASLQLSGAGKVALVTPAPYQRTFESHIIRVRLDEQKAHPPFYFYFFRSPRGRETMYSIVEQVSAAGIRASDLSLLPVPCPPVSDQRAIAEVLGSLDDKIDANQRMNKTLEATAAALFKAWFVAFEPVKAKAAGAKAFPSVPQSLFHILPSSLVAAPNLPLLEIPKEWRVGIVGDEVRVVGGSTPSTNEPRYWDNGTHCWATPKDLSRIDGPILLDTERRITDAGLASISSALLPKGTLLLSSRAPIGYLALAEVPTAINQGFIGMVCDKTLSAAYMLNWCRASMEDIKSRANGTTFQEISKGSFRPMPILVPPEAVVRAFDALVTPLYEAITANLRENFALTALRDSLLSKLLSGEVRVSPSLGAQKAVNDRQKETVA